MAGEGVGHVLLHSGFQHELLRKWQSPNTDITQTHLVYPVFVTLVYLAYRLLRDRLESGGRILHPICLQLWNVLVPRLGPRDVGGFICDYEHRSHYFSFQ